MDVSSTFRRSIGMLHRIGRRYGMTALVLYSIVAVFAVAYGVAHLVWPDLPEHRAVVVGLLAAGPLAVAFLWERLGGLNIFGVEITLAPFNVPIVDALATVLSGSIPLPRSRFLADSAVDTITEGIA